MPLNNSGVATLAALLLACGGGAPAQAQRSTAPATSNELQPPADLPQGPGPRGTSGQEQRYDTVGYTGSFDGSGASVSHASLPVGSFVELTALDTGRTIVATVTANGSSPRIVDLSPDAAQQLGVTDGAPVRIRLVTPNPQDQTALRSGRVAATRLDAPQSLLIALRKKLPARSMPTPTRAVPTRTTTPRPAPPRPAPGRQTTAPPGASYAPPAARPSVQAAPARSGAGFVVQVGAFSTRERAQSVAAQVGGQVSPAGRLFRVQIGPFADTVGAQRARDGAARRGYADARILHIE